MGNDSTNEKSLFLKECIADAFFKLLKKKSYNKITVNDIVTIAGVGRMTYFRNFESKYDIIKYRLKSLSKAYYDALTTQPKNDTDSAYHLIKFIYLNKESFKLIEKQCPFILFLYFLQGALEDRKDDIEDEFKISFFSTGLYGMVTTWISHDFKETPEEIFSMMKKWIILNDNN